MKPPRLYLLLILFITTIPQLLRADIVYPARLEIKEIEAGVFNVTFNLPVINNKRLKAQPVLPPFCESITPHEISGGAATYTETWQMRCDPRRLFGQQFGVEGLIGTQIDVILVLEMFNGRSYTATLKPAKAIFIVPAPPSLLTLSGEALVSGMQSILRGPEMLLLLFLLAFLLPEHRSLVAALLAFVLAHAAGQLLAQQQWLQLSAHLAPLFTVFIAVLPALKLGRGEKNAFSVLQPLWLTAIFIGLLFGGANPETLSLQGLSRFEKQLLFFGFNGGIAAGVLLGYLLFSESNKVLKGIPRFAHSENLMPKVLHLGSIVAVGLFFYRLSVFIFFPSILPEVPAESFIIAIVLGMWLGTSTPPLNEWVTSILLVLLVTGLIAGLSGLELPLSSLVIFGSLFFFGVVLAAKREFPGTIILLVAAMAVIYYTAYTANFIQENLSKPIANASGALVVAVFIAYLSLKSTSESEKPLPPGIRLIGSGAALIAVLFRSREYLHWFDTTVATEYALGLVRLPLLSLGLLIIALLVWPRRRKIHQHLNLNLSKPLAHWVLLMLAFFVVPLGTFKAKNLFFTPDAPRDEQARRILQQVLTNTYNAFNIEDENRLYDQLSQSVSGELVADLYLDSRRRLTAGVRQGAEVTVKDVSILSVGDRVAGINASDGFSYECKWVVTARVKHLQHVHHRQNIYTGMLTIKVNDEKWKIDQVTLHSEDRVIIPWRAG